MLTFLAPFALSVASAQTFDAPSSWLIESQVDLPALMWFGATLNTESRVLGWDVTLRLDCPAGEAVGRRTEVRCTIADFAIQAEALPGDGEGLERVLLDVDEKLTGADLVLRTGPDNSLRSVQLEGLQILRRRDNAMRENLRLMLSRAVAGFDMPIPDRDAEAGWEQRGSWIAQMPAGAGTLSGGKVIHEIAASTDSTWTIASSGRLVMEPHSQWDSPPIGLTRTVQRQEGGLHPSSWGSWGGTIGMDAMLDTLMEATAVVDAETGALQERSWTSEAWPTPSSKIATAAKGYVYSQVGSIVRLEEGQTVDVGETREVEPDGPTPSAIQNWESLGVDW